MTNTRGQKWFCGIWGSQLWLLISDHVASQCRVESLNNWELSLCLFRVNSLNFDLKDVVSQTCFTVLRNGRLVTCRKLSRDKHICEMLSSKNFCEVYLICCFIGLVFLPKKTTSTHLQLVHLQAGAPVPVQEDGLAIHSLHGGGGCAHVACLSSNLQICQNYCHAILKIHLKCVSLS